MPGPNIQMPASLMEMFDYVRDENGNVLQISMRPEWASMLSGVQQVTFAGSRSGSSAARPTSSDMLRWAGMPFFDQTLGVPVFLKHASSNVWVRADGTVA